MIDFYKRVEKVREDKELKKGEFAVKIGSKSGTYSTLLKGKTANGELAITLNKLFNVNLNWLLTGIGEMYNKSEVNRPCNFVNYTRELIKNSITYKNHLFLGAVSNDGVEMYIKIIKSYFDEITITPHFVNTREKNINENIVNDNNIIVLTHMDLFAVIEIGNIITKALVSGLEIKSKLILIADIAEDPEILEIINSFCISNLEDNSDTFDFLEKMKELEDKYKK